MSPAWLLLAPALALAVVGLLHLVAVLCVYTVIILKFKVWYPPVINILLTEKPWPDGLALAFQNASWAKAVIKPSFWPGLAWPIWARLGSAHGLRSQAGPGTTLLPSMGEDGRLSKTKSTLGLRKTKLLVESDPARCKSAQCD